MRILHMMGGGDIGGAKTHIFSLVRELNRYHEVCMVSFRDGPFPREMMEEGLQVELVLSRNPLSARDVVLRLIDEKQPEIIHCHGARANMIGAMVRAKRDLPVMTTMHSDYRLDYMGKPWKQYTLGTINAASLRFLDFYQAVSDRMAQTLISRGFSPYQMMTIYNGMDFDRPQEKVDRIAYCREQYGADVDDSMVLCGLAARLTAVKDIPTALTGFARAAAKQPQLRLFLAGTGEDEDKLRAQAQALGVADQVVFCGWVTEIARFFAAMDVTLLTSLSETFPYSILEGIREGCVPICSDVGGMSELIEDGETGYIFQPGDAEALADALAAVASDAKRRKLFAERQRERAVASYSVDAMRRTQEENYRHVMARFSRQKKARDGVVLYEQDGLRHILQRLREQDEDQPIRVISSDPAQMRLSERVMSYSPDQAQMAMNCSETFLCSGEDAESAALARKCGCRIVRTPRKNDERTQ